MKSSYRFCLYVIILAAAFLLRVEATQAQVVFKRNLPVVKTESQPQANTWKSPPVSSVTGSITVTVTWDKAFGLPPMYPGAKETYPMPCGLFVIAVANETERIKTSEGGTLTTENGPAGRYICTYVIDGLPKVQELRVTPSFVDLRVWETYPWLLVYSGGDTAPPSGSYRFLDGFGRVTLTDAEPTVNINFTVRYKRIPIKMF